MTVLHQRRLGLCLAIFGFILGAFAGLCLGRGMLLRTAKADLSDYAQQLSRNADALRAELSVSFNELNTQRFPLCSNPDLWALQTRTFRSSQLKDIGRTHNGMLYCSAFLGRLKKPYVEGIPTSPWYLLPWEVTMVLSSNWVIWMLFSARMHLTIGIARTSAT
jgi:sensor c-di-GMP phosphodiesterase-like protein